MEKNNPLFSFIVPVYNVEKYLNQCIESIINQEYKDFELILVDDGSKDNSGKICDEYAEKDIRVHAIHKENGGVSQARNYGIEKAVGKYLLFIDSDDYIEKNSLGYIADKVKDKEYDLVFFKGHKIYEDGRKEEVDQDFYIEENKTKEEILEYISKLSKFPGSACTKLIRKELLIKNNILFEKGIISFEDIEFVINVLKSSNKISSINIPFYNYRQNRKGSATSITTSKNVNSMIEVIKRQSKEKIENKLEEYINHFLAYEYIILLANYISLGKEEKKKVNEDVYKYKWLLNYNNNKKVKIARIMKRIVGIRITAKALGMILILKNQK